MAIRWRLNIVQLIVLVSMFGCSPATTITVMKHIEDAQASFPGDYASCSEFVDKSRNQEMFGLSWRFTLYEVHNEEVYREVQIWRCLAERGWQPALQAIGPTRATENDFCRVLRECTIGTMLSGTVPERISGLALTALAERIFADDTVMGMGRAITICLQQHNWKLVRGAACLEPGRDSVSHSVILQPIIDEFAGKFVPSGKTLILDTGQGIRWRKAQASRSSTASSAASGINQIDAECRGNLQDAFGIIANLNRQSAEGRTDWRLPRVDEVLSLANYAAWSGMALPGTNPAKILGLVWTGEKDAQGVPLSVNLATRKVVPLGEAGMYCALILPVAGHGWHSSVLSKQK